MKRRGIGLFLLIGLLVTLLGMFVYADDSSNEADILYKAALEATSSKEYELEDGNSISGVELWNDLAESAEQLLMINKDNYNKLSNSAKKEFVGDFVDIASSLVSDSKISTSTVKDWYKSLQLNTSVGTLLMSNILSGTNSNKGTSASETEGVAESSEQGSLLQRISDLEERVAKLEELLGE